MVVILLLLITTLVDAAKELESELIKLGVKAKGYKSNAADFHQAQELVDHIILKILKPLIY